MASAGVPEDGPVRLGPVQLPDGRRLSRWGEPRMWAAFEPVADAGLVWQALTDMHPDTGLVPILLEFLHGGHTGRPWDGEGLGLPCDLGGGGPARCRGRVRRGVGLLGTDRAGDAVGLGGR